MVDDRPVDLLHGALFLERLDLIVDVVFLFIVARHVDGFVLFLLFALIEFEKVLSIGLGAVADAVLILAADLEVFASVHLQSLLHPHASDHPFEITFIDRFATLFLPWTG